MDYSSSKASSIEENIIIHEGPHHGDRPMLQPQNNDNQQQQPQRPGKSLKKKQDQAIRHQKLAVAWKRGERKYVHGVKSMSSPEANVYQKLLKLAASAGPDNLYSVEHRTISKRDCLDGGDYARMDPPSFWAGSEKFADNMEGYQYYLWNYIGAPAYDVLSDGIETDDEDVVRNLEGVARLREWIKHVEFGLDRDTDQSICRIHLGLGQGYTNWVPLFKMAKILDPAPYITQAKTI